MADGGIIEAIPCATALREGATHVLVLRSRPVHYRKPVYGSVAETLGIRGERALVRLLRDHRDADNQHADDLERMTATADGPVHQIAVPGRHASHRPSRGERRPSRRGGQARRGCDGAGDPRGTRRAADWQPVAYRRALAAVAP